ncbi:MAG: hypothetical protein DHS20C21_13250 [Gemmatimonadota bacterium]|nr:MAG: hypothetical protein DHS20C21_13250 [Gemmatimonadota bacterium]
MFRTLTLFVVLSFATGAFAGELCLVDSPNAINATVNCSQPQLLWDNSYVGYSTEGAPCEVGTFCGFDPQRNEGLEGYRWLISASDTDPYENTGPLPQGIVELSLWLECSVSEGMAAVEFGLDNPDGTLIPLALAPQNGFLNAGTPTHILMAVGGCPTGPVLAAYLLVLNLGPVSVESQSWAGIKSMYR